MMRRKHARKQFIICSNADQGENHSELWNDPELTAIDVTRRGKLELEPKNIEAQVFLNRKGTIEVFCKREVFKSVFALLERKLVPEDKELKMDLVKVPTTYSFSLDYLDIVLYAVLINTIIGVTLYFVHLYSPLPQMILWAILIPLLAGLLVIWYRWRTIFPRECCVQINN